MKIIDTFSQITDCFTNNIFNMENWEKYANAISPNLAVKLRDDIADYNFQNDVFPLLNSVAHHFDQLNTAHQSFLLLTDGLPEKMQNILQTDLTDLNVSVIFYLGLCNSASWGQYLNSLL